MQSRDSHSLNGDPPLDLQWPSKHFQQTTRNLKNPYNGNKTLANVSAHVFEIMNHLNSSIAKRHMQVCNPHQNSMYSLVSQS